MLAGHHIFPYGAQSSQQLVIETQTQRSIQKIRFKRGELALFQGEAAVPFVRLLAWQHSRIVTIEMQIFQPDESLQRQPIMRTPVTMRIDSGLVLVAGVELTAGIEVVVGISPVIEQLRVSLCFMRQCG